MSSITERIRPSSAEARSLAHLGLGDFELETRAGGALAQPPPDGWTPTGLDRSFYLDLTEVIVRAAHDWQDEHGAIIDPVKGEEHAQTTPRYAAPGAVLLAFGRAEDLRESVFRAMDWSCMRLATEQAKAADFWMRELATVYMCLESVADDERLARWRRDLSSIEPEKTYRHVRPDGSGLDELHNWTVYAAAGEFLRQVAGLRPGGEDSLWGEAFFEKYMPAQLTHFTPNGMYRDPGDPITYDITTRLQIATALAFGYEGPLEDDLCELLRRGGLTQLLFASAEGYVPYGGRSSQFHFQEAILSALCELEARRYKSSDSRLAGAFKRQARRAACAVRRWVLDVQPFRHVKSGFEPSALHGCDSYAVPSCYGLLAASFFGLAAIFADDDIEESPCPAEVGGYVFELKDAFHKVFAASGGTSIEIDTRADFRHDATGLGRFHRVGVPLELGPGMPLTSTPHYTVAEEYKAKRNLAVGPAWQAAGEWTRLAELSEGLDCELAVHRETPAEVAFRLRYVHAPTQTVITEEYSLREGALNVRSGVTQDGKPVEGIRFLIPLLATDGTDEACVQMRRGRAGVVYRGAVLTIRFDPTLGVSMDEAPAGNRNGLYRCLTLEAPSHRIAVELSLAMEEGVPVS